VTAAGTSDLAFPLFRQPERPPWRVFVRQQRDHLGQFEISQ
jgi:hypothetical protein